MNEKPIENRGEIIIYRAEDNTVQLDVRMENETVWLTQKQMADLFGVKRPAITKHLRNIFIEGELNPNSVSSILEHTAADGKVYSTLFYNLDAILSVGYRVNSKRAIAFRQWSSAAYGQGVLKELSQKLTERFGKGWSVETLTKCRKFYNVYAISSNKQTKLSTGSNSSPAETKSDLITPPPSVAAESHK